MPANDSVRHNLDFLTVNSQNSFDSVEPILKWVGGKRSLLEELNKVIPEPAPGGTYFEPFLGAGAVLLSRTGSYGLVGYDTNEELIDTYLTVKSQHKKLISRLKTHEEKHSKEYFYEVRGWDRLDTWKKTGKLERSARMIFLNKTCFNGLYRVNLKGEFNVPFGDYANPLIVDEYRIDELSRFLKSKLPDGSSRVTVRKADYTFVESQAKQGDVVYFDPPYDPLSKSSSFTGYSSQGFDEFDQERLFILASTLVKKGVTVVMSNSSTKRIKELCIKYGFKASSVPISRKLAAKSSSRKPIKELIITHE
jgi:DNA adenine methylase